MARTLIILTPASARSAISNADLYRPLLEARKGHYALTFVSLGTSSDALAVAEMDGGEGGI